MKLECDAGFILCGSDTRAYVWKYRSPPLENNPGWASCIEGREWNEGRLLLLRPQHQPQLVGILKIRVPRQYPHGVT